MARKDCLAFSKECNHCGIPGHFRSVCEKIKTEKKSRANAAAVDEDMGEYQDPQDENLSFAFATRQDQDFRLGPNTIGRP